MNDENLKKENHQLHIKVAALEELLKEYEQTAIDQSNSLERRNAELDASRARFQNILDMASDAIVSADEDRKIILFNIQAQKIFGCGAHEVLGAKFESLLPERFRGKLETLNQGLEVSGLRKNDQEFPAEIKLSMASLEGKSILTAIIRDLTEQKKLERLVFQSEKMSAIGQLAGGVAHEINNPLGVILGFSQNVAKRIPPGDPLELPLKSIEREAVRCKNLVRDLLTFSRVGKIEKETIDLADTIEGALSLVLAQGKIKNVELVKEFSEIPPITANRTQIQQIIINLSNNAMDAMPEGGTLTLRVKKAKMEDREAVEIQVQDTGEGIPAEIRSKIFDPFFTTKEVGKGTGLGLSLVFEIVQQHQGRILLESAVGKGTSFQVFLPVT